ncbi:unnamed protein product [marine sediment metagenome]|uniref:Uncharacterized protein n=1 Tax=marine sediment metagenome TaxID=412755 RepID=X1Q2U4_9ZZZZ
MNVLERILMLKKILKEAVKLATWQETIFTDLQAHKADASAHHARYTDAEAQATVKANVEVGDLKTPTKALAMNSQNITGVASLTATELHGTTYWGDVYLEDVECPACRRKFKMGDRLVFIVNKAEKKFITAIPVHLTCDGGQ